MSNDDNQDGYLKKFAMKWRDIIDYAKALESESPPPTIPDTHALISKFFLDNSRLRKCRMCSKEYTGMRDICDDQRCFYALQAQMQYNREHVWHRGIDYNGLGRRTLIIDSLPEQTEQSTGMKQFDHLPPTIAEPDGYHKNEK